MTSTLESPTHSPRMVERAAVVLHGHAELAQSALGRLERVAKERGVELVGDGDESPDIAVVLGGDGTMLRALARYLGRNVPVFGVNFGRVGFLASLTPDRLEEGIARVFAGEYVAVDLPTLDVDADGKRRVAINDVVAHSSVLGRMIELSWAVGGEDLGRVPCDGIICATSTGSTAYNLSNGGPVLVRGLDAMVITFIAAHSLHARPMVVPRGLELVIRNRTPDVPASVIADGHAFAEIEGDAPIAVRLGDRKSLLATLPETTFFRRYRETFAS
jgi:NAD+ kinase